MRRLPLVCLIVACTSEPAGPGETSGDLDTGQGEGASGSSSGGAPTSTGGTTGSASTSGTDTGPTESTGSTGSTGPALDESSGTSGEASSTTGPPGDVDADGVPDGQDNCPGEPNPEQNDGDGDGVGDACDDDDDDDGVPDADDGCPLVADPTQTDTDMDGTGDACDDDLDGDNIPDGDDVFPDDGMAPGKAEAAKMYAHSSSTLAQIDTETYEVTVIGDFGWPGGMDSMTDIAIDRHGQLFGVSFGRLYVCQPQTAECWDLGMLMAEYNGLTWIPAGTLLPDKDALIGITTDGTWNHLTVVDQMVMGVKLGAYGGTYESAGDAFSIENVGTYAAVYKAGVNTTLIVRVDPLTGKVQSELAILPLSTVWGLAGWEGAIVAFDFTGEMAVVDPMTMAITPLGPKGTEWWGAGVSTVLPQ